MPRLLPKVALAHLESLAMDVEPAHPPASDDVIDCLPPITVREDCHGGSLPTLNASVRLHAVGNGWTSAIPECTLEKLTVVFVGVGGAGWWCVKTSTA